MRKSTALAIVLSKTLALAGFAANPAERFNVPKRNRAAVRRERRPGITVPVDGGRKDCKGADPWRSAEAASAQVSILFADARSAADVVMTVNRPMTFDYASRVRSPG